MSRSMVRSGVAMTVAVLSFTGCFNYIPADFATLPAGDHVRVEVTPAVAAGLADVTDLPGRVLNGVVIRREEDELFIRIPIATRQLGFHSQELGQDVRVTQPEILVLERREFDHKGTGALVAGTVAAAATVVYYIMRAFGDEEDPGEPCPDCNGNMTPILSIPVR